MARFNVTLEENTIRVQVGENTAAAAASAAQAQAWAESISGVASRVTDTTRVSENLLSAATAGWATNQRVNPANGLLTSLSGWESSPFIPVAAGTYVTNLDGFFALYDANQNFVVNLSASPAWVLPVLTVPSAGFVRGSYQVVGGIQRSQIFFQPGSAWPTAPVEPAGALLRSDRLLNVTAAAFPDDAIGPDKVTMWQPGQNAANPVGRVDGFFMATNGTPVANATFSYWPPFKVEPGQVWTANQGMRFVTFFDAGGKPQASVGITTTVNTFTVPPLAQFAVITSTASAVGTFAVALGATAPTYTPYRWEGRAALPDGTPLVWGTPPGANIVSAIDTQLGSTEWRGSSAIPDTFGLARLRETRQRLRSLRGGTTGLPAQINIGVIGDSFTHDSGRYVLKTARALWAKYHAGHPNVLDGPIGPGWISFNGAGSGSFPNGTIYWNNIVTGAGGWTTANGTGNGPDSGRETSSTAGAHLQFFWSRYSEAMTWRLFAEGGSGVIRYRWTDAGSWTTIDLSALAAGVQIITLAGMPGSGSGTVRFEVVSGTVQLYGVDVRLAATAGVIVHKLGGTGTSAQQWAALNASRFQAGIAGLGLDLAIIMHGTNDQAAGRTKAQFKADIITIVDRLRAARPTMDILLAPPPENQRTTNAIAMSEYQAAMFEIARDDRDVAFANTQNAFGVVPADYAAGSARPWWSVDLVHPDNATGGWALADVVLAAIGEQSA